MGADSKFEDCASLVFINRLMRCRLSKNPPKRLARNRYRQTSSALQTKTAAFTPENLEVTFSSTAQHLLGIPAWQTRHLAALRARSTE